MSGPGEFAFFTNGDETGAENLSDPSGENEAAGVDSDDFVNFFALSGFGEEVHGGFEEFSVA
jgi:hypothetical protein